MAKSIYQILTDLTTTTSVPGYGSEVEHSLPANLFPTDKQFENKEELLAWAEEKGITHAVLQKGIQKFLIDVRAAFKSSKKDEEWTEELGQANVDAMEWAVTNRPNQGGSKAVSAAILDTGGRLAKAMKDNGLPVDQIKAILANTYKPEEVNAIIASLNE